MTQNLLLIWPKILSVVGAMVVLFAFALAIGLPSRSKTLPGSSGHREVDEEGIHEEIRPDGYIDSFSKEIEEAGGSLPLVVRIAIPAVFITWLLYLILNWMRR